MKTSPFSMYSASLLSMALLIHGCATISSRPIQPATSNPRPELSNLETKPGETSPNGGSGLSEKPAAGVTYFLPRRLVKFSAKRSLLDPKEIAQRLELAKKSHEAAEKVSAAEAAVVKSGQALFDDIGCGKPEKSSTEACTRINADLTIAKSKQSLAEKSTLELAETVRKANEELDAARRLGSEGRCAYKFEAKLEALPVQADPNLGFTLDTDHSFLRDDTLDVSVNAQGLLTSSKSVVVDRTADILAEVAGAAAALFGGNPLTALSNFTEDFQASPPIPLRCEPEPLVVVRIIDPASETELANLESDLSKVGLPYRLSLSDRIEKVETDFTKEEKQGRLFYRTARPVVLEIRECNGLPQAGSKSSCESHPVDSVVLMLPQAGPVAYIPMEAAWFVRSVSEVTFEDGILTKWHTEQPSELLEVVRLPAKIMSSMISVPAQIFSLQVDYSSKVAAFAESQRARMESEAKADLIRLCVDAAGDDYTKLKECFPAPEKE